MRRYLTAKWGLGILLLAVVACNLPSLASQVTPSPDACPYATDPLISVMQTNWRDCLKCPTAASQTYQYEWMPFERGSMFYHPQNSIYVLYDDGTYQEFDDPEPLVGDPDPSISPPPGLYKPDGMFGTIWHTFPEIQRRLGWATTPTVSYPGIDQAFIEQGTIVVALGNGDLIGLFPFSNSWARLPIDRIPGYYGGIPATPAAGLLSLGGMSLLVVIGMVVTRQRTR